ncbi:MAG: hypothetical protein ACH0QD_11740 [Tepidibacillus sp.]
MQVTHHHAIFTMDEGLWPIFLKHRKMLKDLMDGAVRKVQEWFQKKLKVTPGIIAELHTFGARMNFNPHAKISFRLKYIKTAGIRPVFLISSQ